MPPKPASKAYRDRQRERLARLGLDSYQVIEQLVADLMRCGRRPREAWRLARELTQDEVAARFNEIRGDPDVRMRGSRICEYEKWPIGGVRPSVRVLKILAIIYETTCDRLVDVNDLEAMPTQDREAFLDVSDQRYGSSQEILSPRRNHRRVSARDGRKDPRVNRLITEDQLSILQWPSRPSPGLSSDQSGGGLPGEVTHFTGRDEPMAELRARIAEQDPRGTVVAIYAIDGMAGVGKTAFARRAAQEFTTRYPDGAIWVDLYGHTPDMQPREPSTVLEQMLLQLGVRPEAIKADFAERQEQWRHQIHARRMLIVLDNAFTSDQVLPLLPEAPSCLVLITSRCKLTGLTDAYPLSLDVLGWDEAERLFIRLVGEQRCEDRDAVRKILSACGRLPLAIRLIAGRLRHHRGELLADVALEFADQTAALDGFVAEHLSVRAAFEWSYRRLTDAQRRAFRLLGWHPGPEVTRVVMVALAAVSPALGRQLLRELVDHNLLEQLSAASVLGNPRYRMHDLVRLYARECADAEELPAERSVALDRLASSYLNLIGEADRLLRPYVSHRPGVDIAPVTNVLTFADASRACAWLTVERHNLLACVRAMRPSTETADLSNLLAVHLRDLGFWSEVRYLYSQALAVYRHLGDRRGEVDALWGLGDVQWLVGEYNQARKYHNEGLTIARQFGYRRAEAEALWGLGDVERLVAEYGRAREYYTQALILAQELGDKRSEFESLWGLGEIERVVGGCDQARRYYIQAQTVAQDIGDRHSEVDALRGLGEVERLVGEYNHAREYHSQALMLAQHLGDRRCEADALRGLGEVERLVGEYNHAREYHSQALTLAQHLGDRRCEIDALRGLGEVERLVGEYNHARGYHTQALSLARRLGYRLGEFHALRGLGEVDRLVGEYNHAREYHTQALTLAQHLGDRRSEAEALWGLGHVAIDTVEYSKARVLWRRALAICEELELPFAETIRAAICQLDG